VHARFLIRGINENGCNLFGQSGIVLSSGFVFQLGRSYLLSPVPEKILYARTRLDSLSQGLRRWWIVVRKFAVTERSTCKSHCK
jgi:hypothetical protein